MDFQINLVEQVDQYGLDNRLAGKRKTILLSHIEPVISLFKINCYVKLSFSWKPGFGAERSRFGHL